MTGTAGAAGPAPAPGAAWQGGENDEGGDPGCWPCARPALLADDELRRPRSSRAVRPWARRLVLNGAGVDGDLRAEPLEPAR